MPGSLDEVISFLVNACEERNVVYLQHDQRLLA